MTHTNYLIIGQGICGSFLSWYLEREGKSSIVIDNNDPSSSSRVAAGVINPVTGRRIVKTWMIDELLPFAQRAYQELGDQLHAELLPERAIVNLFPSAQMRNAFAERLQEEEEYLRLTPDDHAFAAYFEYHFGSGEIFPAYVARLQELLCLWRKHLDDSKALRAEEFSIEHLQVKEDAVTYKDIHAEKVIFCDGVASSSNVYFKNLPFALNKGEALIIHARDLPESFVYKKAITLVPLGNNLFWAGASHDWDFQDALPSSFFREKTEKQLKHWLRIPFRIESHVASVRPATLERRPFVGIHPHLPAVGILNGMGTKGCSLAPYFAHQFARHLVRNVSILPGADVRRFSRILQPSL